MQGKKNKKILEIRNESDYSFFKFFKVFNLICLFYFWLHWFFVALYGLSLAAWAGGYSVAVNRLLIAVASLVVEYRL